MPDTTDDQVYLTETRTDQMGEWTDVWHTPPPDKTVPFRVLDCRWDNLSTRHIYAIELA